jgi:hypothetical protein
MYRDVKYNIQGLRGPNTGSSSKDVGFNDQVPIFRFTTPAPRFETHDQGLGILGLGVDL